MYLSTYKDMGDNFFEIVFQYADFNFDGRDEVEDPLADALDEAELGVVTGGGSGPDTCNIDVEVADFDAGLALVRKVLKELNVAPSTIINFYIEGQEEPQEYCLYD
jgi:hypothetical protein